ncbi:hypothetical protein Syun_008035 [Stephania yunnanensis]|uniref:Uncharacterized protein n=1 Tax=Stephania yunnanensis TaxID=152371 RepID=A0AAP0Q0T7_9MAGN
MRSESPSYLYNPSRADTKAELQNLRNIVEHRLGAFRPIVIQGVADIVLWILKSDHRFNTPLHKRVEVEKLLNPIGDQVFEQMLLTTQCITDYLTQRSTIHPYRFVAHNDMPITTMEDVVAYNLLIQVHGNDREKAFDMVLILKNQTVPSVNAQMIGDLLGRIWDRADCDLLVFIISKLFPDFVRRWNGLAFYVIPHSRQNFEDEKVIDTLRIFTLAAPDDNLRVLDFADFADFFECCRCPIDDERGAWSGGFEESQNELGNVQRRRYMLHEHEQRRKGNGNGDDAVEKMKNEGERSSSLGERSSSLVHFLKSIFRDFSLPPPKPPLVSSSPPPKALTKQRNRAIRSHRLRRLSSILSSLLSGRAVSSMTGPQISNPQQIWRLRSVALNSLSRSLRLSLDHRPQIPNPQQVVLALHCSLVALPCSGRVRLSCTISIRASAPLGSHFVLSFSLLFDLCSVVLCSHSFRASLCLIGEFSLFPLEPLFMVNW